jgi:branched-chain amino acid aminotransferase
MIWIDGRLHRDGEATVSALDHGITVGDGVFETLKVLGGTPVARRRHLDRLARSAAAMGFELPDRAVLERAIEEVVAANRLADCRLRLTVTSGEGPLGSGRELSRPTVVAAVTPLDVVPPTTAVVTVPWVRNERSPLAGVKSTSYGENVVALARARAAGASEAILANTRGELCEGTGSNIFLVLDGELLTPPLSSGCLAGIARSLVLEACAVVERAVPLEALTEAAEVFLTSSIRDVQAVGSVDGRVLSAPGPRTEAAAAAYHALLARNLDP